MSDTKELGMYVMLLHYVKVQGLVFKSSAYCSPVGNSVSAPPHIWTAEDRTQSWSCSRALYKPA